jgi:hypothetical protein
MKIYSDAEKEYSKALEYARIITGMHPDNPVYSLEELRLIIKMKQYEEARILSRELANRINLASKLNVAQKEHFLSEIESITKRGIK